MKRYQKIIYAVFALAFMLVGSGAALSGMEKMQVLAKEGDSTASAKANPEEDTMSAAVPVPAPGASSFMADNETAPGAGTTDIMTTADVPTTVPGTTTPNYLYHPAGTTVTPIPTPPILVTADGAKPIVTLDYTNYEAWLTVGPRDKYIVLEVMKAKKTKDTFTFTSSAQYMYDLSEYAYKTTPTAQTGSATTKTVRVDLSFLKATSMQYIRIHGDANPLIDSGVIAINPQPKKPSIKYAGGVFTAKIDKKDQALTPALLSNYEYKPLYGSRWDSLGNYSGTASEIAGTTILVREKATLTMPASVETKLKISAAAKAPKVAIDYVKGIVSIPKGVEFKISAKGKESGAWITYENGAAAKLEPKKLLDIPIVNAMFTAEEKTAILEKDGFSIIARTKAVEKDGKVTKAASQPTFVTIPPTTKVTKVENENKILGSATTIYLTYENVEKGVALTAFGGNFDYSVDDGKNWKTVKADAKKATVATLKKDVKAVLIRESGTKETKAKDGVVTPARLPSSNSISTAWQPPLELVLTGNGVGSSDTVMVSEGEAMEIFITVKSGKDEINGVTVKSTTATTLPGASVTTEKLTFTAPAYNGNGTNTYVLEIAAEKANYTSDTRKLTVTVTQKTATAAQ